ncbi:hypothetical protein Bca52824_003957 [Brassica carinata]|uniref:CRC domain-containing protein n=1 Tax=Brassica carinata TaxID=52824 RepID=A0A8X7WNS6_BRACI|nr:hypothetical protein Bca52824_003957 [Brassica carinata]
MKHTVWWSKVDGVLCLGKYKLQTNLKRAQIVLKFSGNKVLRIKGDASTGIMQFVFELLRKAQDVWRYYTYVYDEWKFRFRAKLLMEITKRSGLMVLCFFSCEGWNPGVGALPLKGWPLTGLDNMRQDLGPQGQRAFLQNQGQFQLPPQQQQQQQIMARDQGQGNMTNSSMYGQQNANDGSIGYPVPLNSSKPINMPPVQQYSSQQQDPLLSQQNNYKRTRTGNTVGPFNSQPSTPLTHTPIEGVAITGNMPKGPVMYVSDAIGDLASSANQLAQKAKENEQKLKAGEGESPKRLCTCKKSKCLKLYCECFAAGVYCSTVPPCSCTDCNNIPLYNETIFATRKTILSRNPLAFSPKIFGKSSDSVQKNRGDASKTPASGRHIRGCNCKKSNCSNKYCECFQGGVGCSRHCRCELCKNKFNAKRL